MKQLGILAAPVVGDRCWLVIMAMVTLAELGCWAASHSAGFAPGPWLITYLGMAYAGLAAALAMRRLLRPNAGRAGWPVLIIGTTLIANGASLLLPLKFAIPQEIPFWLDAPLAAAERAAFGADPWQILDHYLGWATLPLDRLYGIWLPFQLLILFAVMLDPPSRAKSRALIAYSLAWLLLGVVAAALFSSAGPIFHARLSDGDDFALLGEALRARGATMAIFESDAVWSALASGKPGLVAGISAFPSIHVAISLWMFLAGKSS